MKQAGQIALVAFPNTDLSSRKLRPVLLLRQVSQRYDDWLVCMISSQLWQEEAAIDEVINTEDTDFTGSGLKSPSVIRLTRVAVVESSVLVGRIGEIGDDRLLRLRQRLAAWLTQEAP